VDFELNDDQQALRRSDPDREPLEPESPARDEDEDEDGGDEEDAAADAQDGDPVVEQGQDGGGGAERLQHADDQIASIAQGSQVVQVAVVQDQLQDARDQDGPKDQGPAEHRGIGLADDDGGHDPEHDQRVVHEHEQRAPPRHSAE